MGWCVVGDNKADVHAPTAVDEFELSILDEHSDLALDLVVLLAPPALEVGLLHIDELAIRVHQQLLNHLEGASTVTYKREAMTAYRR